MWKAENYNARLGAARWRCRKEEKKSGKLECALLSDVYSVVIWRESCANKQCVLPYPRPVMTWTNLMPLQYLKTPTVALYYRQVALLSQRKKKNSGKLQKWKKRQTRKKTNEFWRLCKRRAWVWEMNVLIFGVQGFSPCKKQTNTVLMQKLIFVLKPKCRK